MKLLTSDKTFTPPSIPLPIVTAAYCMQSGNLSNSVHKVANTSYKNLGVNSPTRLNQKISGLNSVNSKIRPQYSLTKDSEMVSSPLSETQVLASKTMSSKSGLSPSTLESNHDLMTHDNIGLLSFMKSLMGEKAFNSISLLSICFFVSGGLLMFYLLNLI